MLSGWWVGGLDVVLKVCCARPIGQRDIDLKRLAWPIKREVDAVARAVFGKLFLERRKVGDWDAVHGNNAIARADTRCGRSTVRKGGGHLNWLGLEATWMPK